MPYNPAPSALNPPTTTAPSRAPTNSHDERAGYQDRANAWNGEERRTEKQPLNATPEGAKLPPVLHAVAGIVVPDHVLVGMIVLADDGHLLHVKPRPLQILHGFLGLGVGFV